MLVTLSLLVVTTAASVQGVYFSSVGKGVGAGYIKYLNRVQDIVLEQGECSKTLTESQVGCPYPYHNIILKPAAVKIELEDDDAYPIISISSSLTAVTIERTGDCSSAVTAKLYKTCLLGLAPPPKLKDVNNFKNEEINEANGLVKLVKKTRGSQLSISGPFQSDSHVSPYLVNNDKYQQLPSSQAKDGYYDNNHLVPQHFAHSHPSADDPPQVKGTHKYFPNKVTTFTEYLQKHLESLHPDESSEKTVKYNSYHLLPTWALNTNRDNKIDFGKVPKTLTESLHSDESSEKTNKYNPYHKLPTWALNTNRDYKIDFGRIPKRLKESLHSDESSEKTSKYNLYHKLPTWALNTNQDIKVDFGRIPKRLKESLHSNESSEVTNKYNPYHKLPTWALNTNQDNKIDFGRIPKRLKESLHSDESSEKTNKYNPYHKLPTWALDTNKDIKVDFGRIPKRQKESVDTHESSEKTNKYNPYHLLVTWALNKNGVNKIDYGRIPIKPKESLHSHESSEQTNKYNTYHLLPNWVLNTNRDNRKDFDGIPKIPKLNHRNRVHYERQHNDCA